MTHPLAPFHPADTPPPPHMHVSRGVWTFTDASYRPAFRRSWTGGAGLDSSHGMVKFHPLASVADLQALLTLLKGCADTCVMSGQYLGSASDADLYPAKDPHGRAGQPKRRAGLARKALHYWRDEPNCLFRMDVDGHSAPGDLVAAWECVLDLLPEALSNATLVVSPSSKAGAPAHLVPDATALRGHVFALLAAPRTLAEQATWAELIRASVPSVDRSIYQPSRLLRTAAPDVAGFADPLAGRRGPFVSRGAGEERAVLPATPPGIAPAAHRPPIATPSVGLDDWNAKTPEQQARTVADLADALQCVPADDYDDWIKTLMQLRAGLPSEIGLELAEGYSRQSESFTEDALDLWDSLNPSQTNYRAIFLNARERGWRETDSTVVGFGLPSAVAERQAVIHVAPPVGSPRSAAPMRHVPVAVAVAGRSFATREDQLVLFAGCVYVVDQHRVLTPDGRMLRPEQFRALHGGYSFMLGGPKARTTNNAWEAFTESQDIAFPRVQSTCFRPDLPFGTVEDGRVNTFVAPDVRMVEGDAGPFLLHLKKLLPREDDSLILLSYLAACVQYPGKKFQWAPVLQGVEGNGKTFFSTVAAYAVGEKFVHWPKASKLVKQFNAWMVGKLLYCVEDIFLPNAGGDVVMEELKPMITGGRGLEIEAKGVDQYSADICGNFIINTNHKDGLRKSANDRRYAMLYCAQQDQFDLKRDFGDAGDYMRKLYDWLDLEDGKAICAHYLARYEIPERYNPAKGAARSPVTSSTDEAVAEGRGMVEQLIMEAIEEARVGFRGGWVSTTFLKHLLEASGKDRFITPAKRRNLMKTLGFVPHPGMHHGRVHNSVQPDNGQPVLFVRAGSPHEMIGSSPSEIARAYTLAQT